MSITSFTQINAWKKAHGLALEIYKVTEKFPKSELYGLISQLRRCAVSVPSNIVEGFKRRSKNDAVHFYVIAESSLEEMKYQLILARDLRYLSTSEWERLNTITEDVGRLLYAWKKNQK